MAHGRLLTVIIATRDRASSLERLLQSLESSIAPAGAEVEVIVIDNQSQDDTGQLLARAAAAAKRFPLHVLHQGPPGKAGALNRGLASAAGDVLLILDDDVAVEAACLEAHVWAHEQGLFDAVQGKILPGLDPDGKPADLSRLLEYNIPLLNHGEAFCEIRGLTGTNISFTREVLEKVGYFNPDLGPGASGFSEDSEYSTRIRKAGFKIGYTPHAVVYHELNPARYGRGYNRRVEYRKGLSRSVYRNDSVVFRVVPDMMANCFRYAVYRLLGRSQKAYKTEGRIFKCWGYLMGKLRREAAFKPPDA